jgi:cell division protease FtsH
MNQMTTGASNDFERATQMARDMVTRYGMSDALGPMVYGENEGEVFLGVRSPRTRTCPKRRWRKVDREIRRIIDEQYALARACSKSNRATRSRRWPRRCSSSKRSTADQINDIMAGKPPRPPKQPQTGADQTTDSKRPDAAPSAPPAPA